MMGVGEWLAQKINIYKMLINYRCLCILYSGTKFQTLLGSDFIIMMCTSLHCVDGIMLPVFILI